jgi:dolichol-phosphate mannosyltransferase
MAPQRSPSIYCGNIIFDASCTGVSLLTAARPLEEERRRKVTVIIPCFNERTTILEVVRRVMAVAFDKLIVVVDNDSTDGTRELLRSVCSNEREVGLGTPGGIAGQRRMDGDGFLLILQPRNLLKAASVKTGLALANSDYVICQDADLEYHPKDILRLLEHAERTGDVAVFGSRLMHRTDIRMDAFHLARIALTKLFCALYDSDITDVATCYKLLRTEVARGLNLEASGFDLDFEIPARLRRQGHAIAEIAVGYTPRDSAHGKKIRWRDGLPATWTLLKVRWR